MGSVARLASPIYREASDQQDLRLELRTAGHMKRIQSANRTGGRPSALTLLDRGVANRANASNQKVRDRQNELYEKQTPKAANT